MQSLPELQSEMSSSKGTGKTKKTIQLTIASLTSRSTAQAIGIGHPAANQCPQLPSRSTWVQSAESSTQSKPMTAYKISFPLTQSSLSSPPVRQSQTTRQPLTKVRATHVHDPFSLFLNWKLLEDKFGFKMMSKDNKINMQMSYLWLDLVACACNPSLQDTETRRQSPRPLACVWGGMGWRAQACNTSS